MNGATSTAISAAWRVAGRVPCAFSLGLRLALIAAAVHCTMGDNGSIDFVSRTSGGTKKPPKACAGDGECAPPTPYCELASATCIECLADPNCEGPKKFCGPGGACVACLTDQNCDKAKPYCDIERFACTECASDAHCEAPKVCDLGERRCVPSCADSSTCEPMKPYCDAARRVCVQCLADGNCADAKKPACGPFGACAECTTNAHCPADRPLCDATTGKCVGCASDLDCPLGRRCDPMQHCVP